MILFIFFIFFYLIFLPKFHILHFISFLHVIQHNQKEATIIHVAERSIQYAFVQVHINNTTKGLKLETHSLEKEKAVTCSCT